MLFDYSQITPADVTGIATEAMAAADDVVTHLVSEDEPAATIDDLNETAVIIAVAYGRSAFMGRVHPDATVREAGIAAEEALSKWSVDLVFRDDLYAAVRAYAESDNGRALTGERGRLLAFWMRDFRRAGHELPSSERQEMAGLQQRLVELAVAFGKNLDDYQDHIDIGPDDLEGLPGDFVARLAPGEEEGTRRVSLDYPEFYPFLRQSARRELRRELAVRFNSKCVDANRPLLEEAIDLRLRIAGMLGLNSWAHHSMEVKMAKDPDRVAAFYEELLPPLAARAEEEIERMRLLLAEDTGDEDGRLQTWDWMYYDDQLRKREYGVDRSAVAAYFPLEAVIDGMLDITGDVFGLTYRRIEDAQAWHPDVLLYEVLDTDSGEHVAYFYADLFPREGKYGHAAAFELVPGHRARKGDYMRPVACIVANFTKPTSAAPALMQHDEVLTLFHEFGHILHQCLTTADMGRFSGANTEWDFVEAPSQIMENWVWDASVLRRFSRHYESGEPIGEDMVDALVAARNLNEALATLRQCYFGLLDLRLHDAAEIKDVEAINRAAHEITLLPFPEGTFLPAGFGHIMGGYDAGYYGYLWSKVFGDDMYSRFEEAGPLDPGVGRDYRRAILEKGGTEDADDLAVGFLGRKPSKDAFLRKLGID